MTPARLQRDRYGLTESSVTPCEPARISESQAWAASTIASLLGDGQALLKPKKNADGKADLNPDWRRRSQLTVTVPP